MKGFLLLLFKTQEEKTMKEPEEGQQDSSVHVYTELILSKMKRMIIPVWLSNKLQLSAAAHYAFSQDGP